MIDETTDPDSVVIERDFDAPVDLVWRMWTEAEHFARWYGPTGSTVPTARMDVRVGGERLVGLRMETPDGPMRMWFTGRYLDVVAPRRLVYTESVCDQDGNVLSPEQMGLPVGHPTTTEVVVELEDLGGRTRMVMTHVGVPGDSPGATGWTMAFDKLAAHLEAPTGP